MTDTILHVWPDFRESGCFWVAGSEPCKPQYVLDHEGENCIEVLPLDWPEGDPRPQLFLRQEGPKWSLGVLSYQDSILQIGEFDHFHLALQDAVRCFEWAREKSKGKSA